MLNNDKEYTAREVAAMIGGSQNSVSQAFRMGNLKARLTPRGLRIKMGDLIEFLAGHRLGSVRAMINRPPFMM